MAELEQQNELLHAAYGGARAQYETALKAVRSAAAASREHAEKLQKAEGFGGVPNGRGGPQNKNENE